MTATKWIFAVALTAAAPTAAMAHAGAHDHMNTGEIIAHLAGFWHFGAGAVVAAALAVAGYVAVKRGAAARAHVTAQRERRR